MEKSAAATLEAPRKNLPSSIDFTKFEWKWIILVGVLLGASGGIRYWRDWQFQSVSKAQEISPFPLSEFPTVLGNWHLKEGSDERLEPEIARIAGANDHVIRTYENENGEEANIMILYGLATFVWPHTPSVCYPSQGFHQTAADKDLIITVPDSGTKVPFREQHFLKSIGGQTDFRAVYHSFLNAGKWGIDVEKNWKAFRYHPGMMKVQVQFQSSRGSKPSDASTQEFLAKIIEEIEHHSAKAAAR